MEDEYLPVSTTTSNFLSINETPSWLSFDQSSNFSSGYVETSESVASYDEFAYNHLGPRRDALYIVVPITIIYLSIFITGTIGNVSTCIVIARNKSMHTATNYYLFSLAVSDLLLLISGLPTEVYLVWSKYPYIFGEHFCRLRGLAAECSTNASVLTITAFTAERYVAICHPFLSHTMSKLSRAIKLILVIWLVALCFALPLAMQFGIVDHHELNPNYVMCVLKITLISHSFEISSFLFFVVPMIVITVLYVMIGLKLRQSNMMKRENGQNRNDGQPSTSVVVAGRKERNCRHHTGRSSRRVLKMLVAVVVAFFLCWAPFHGQRLIAIYGTGDDHVTSKSKWMEFFYLLFTYVSGVLYYVSATINPILYNIMSNKFREAFMETLARSCGRSDFSVRKEQRSYSSLSRSQQQRGGAGLFGSRTVTGAVGQDSTEYSGNSMRDENCQRQSLTLNERNGSETILDSPSDNIEPSARRIDDESFSRKTSRKMSTKSQSRVRVEANSRLSIKSTNTTSQSTNRDETISGKRTERTRRWQENSRSTNHFTSTRSKNRINSTNNNRFVERQRNYGPVTIDTDVERRKKWWRFFKWLPDAKYFGFRRKERTRYASPVDSMTNDIESNREEYSMTSWYNRNTEDQRPV